MAGGKAARNQLKVFTNLIHPFLSRIQDGCISALMWYCLGFPFAFGNEQGPTQGLDGPTRLIPYNGFAGTDDFALNYADTITYPRYVIESRAASRSEGSLLPLVDTGSAPPLYRPGPPPARWGFPNDQSRKAHPLVSCLHFLLVTVSTASGSSNGPSLRPASQSSAAQWPRGPISGLTSATRACSLEWCVLICPAASCSSRRMESCLTIL